MTAPSPVSDVMEISETEMNVGLDEEKSSRREQTPSVDKLPQAKGLEVHTDHTHTVGE